MTGVLCLPCFVFPAFVLSAFRDRDREDTPGASLDNNVCELCGVNPFDYLTEFERHADELAGHPQHWMPWNYRQTLAALTPLRGTAR